MKWARVCGLLGLLLATAASAEVRMRNWDDPDAPQWAEEEAVFPAFPNDENLRPIYVSEMTSHQFLVDGSTLQVGKDGVIRYVLVVRTQGGATNVTFEGIRCETREYKIYGSGRQDGTWAPSRRTAWRPIENKPMNRQHAALSRDYFCPGGVIIQTPAEGREALRLGKHPQAI